MIKTKDITVIGAFTALLIGGQLALSAFSGIEIVTVLFLSFAFYLGVRRAVIVANVFSLIRCLIFGFSPSVLALYIVYYNLFAVIFGFVGNRVEKRLTVKIHIFVVFLAVLVTASFTALDNIITPLFYRFSLAAAKAYCIASLYTMIPQLICTGVTVTLLLPPLLAVYKRINL